MHCLYELIIIFLSARSYDSQSSTILGGNVDDVLKNNHTRSNMMNQRKSDSKCDDLRIRVLVIMDIIAKVSLLLVLGKMIDTRTIKITTPKIQPQQ
jgi:hypothetical protein